MPIVMERELPVIYEDWAEWRVDRGQEDGPLPLISHDRAFCAECWGQGRIWELAANGEGYIPTVCARCSGHGLG